MAKVKLVAIDQLHVSSAKADTIQPGEAFEVSEAEAKQLLDRGLAKKAAAQPKNKMAPAPGNKGKASRPGIISARRR